MGAKSHARVPSRKPKHRLDCPLGSQNTPCMYHFSLAPAVQNVCAHLWFDIIRSALEIDVGEHVESNPLMDLCCDV